MSSGPSLSDIALQTVGEAIAFACGFAAGRAMEPVGVALAQTAWDVAPIRAVDVTTAAAIVAEDVESKDWGAQQARLDGYAPASFDAILGEVLNAPGVPELITLWRRGDIDDAGFAHGLRKAKLETRWDVALEALKDARLDPAAIALAIVRGIVADPGILPVGPPSGDGKVARFPTFNIDAVKEAAAAGIDLDRLSVMVANMGRPASPLEAAHAEWRGVIEHVDYRRAVSESDVRNEWAEAIFEAARAILTPHEYQEAALRGVITNAEADAGAGKHGMSVDDAHLLFEIMGRPLAVHQITTGLARGGTYGGTYDDVPEPYRDAIRRSNIRPEYAVLAHANRYTIPSYFILRAVLQDGGMTTAEFADYGKQLGWPPDLAEKAAAAIAGGATATTDPFVKKAETQLWSALHKSYVDDNATDAQASADLHTLGVTDAAAPAVLALWQTERAIVRRSLTPSQIKKAIGQPGRDDAWASARLLELGYTADDAATFLAE